MNSGDDLTSAVKALALREGFAAAAIAIASAGPIPRADRLKSWIAAGMHGPMKYMGRNLDKRIRPDRLVPSARSVICLAVPYAPPEPSQPPGKRGATIARYARGRDYHKVLKKRCIALMDRIGRIATGFQGRAFVDSAPLMERSLAAAAGLGWIGRNGCLFVPGLGSYVVLCEIVCNLELRAGSPLESRCGDCDACLDACPTGALGADGLVDARRCISCLTTEYRGEIGREFRLRMGTRIIGCDACQEACPHNREVPPGDAELRGPAAMDIGDILAWGDDDWDAATRGRATRRASLETFLRNAVIAAGNSADASLIGPLQRLGRRCPHLGELIDWATQRVK